MAVFWNLVPFPPSHPVQPPKSGRASEPVALNESGGDFDAKIERLVTGALRKGDGIERGSEVYLAIESLTADDCRRLVGNDAALKSVIEKFADADLQIGEQVVSGLIRRWLEFDREAAIAWLPRALDLIPKGKDAHHWIVNALATRLPEPLLALVPARRDAEERADIIEEALAKLAAGDPVKARAWVSNCVDRDDRLIAEKTLQRAIVRADPLRAVELAESTKDRSEAEALLNFAAMSAARMGPGILRQFANLPMKPWMMSEIIGVTALEDPEMAVDLAIQSRGDDDDDDASGTLGSAFTALAKRDPSRCLERLEGLQGRDLAAAVSAIGYMWAAYDPKAALSWLAERSPAERNNINMQMGDRPKDVLVFGFAEWMENAPEEARAWADSLPPGAASDLLQIEVARALTDSGQPAEATQLLARLGKAAKPAVVEQVASSWARRDPKSAAEWAIACEPGPAQNRALAGVVGTWANQDQPAVEQWLSQFPPGEARDRSIMAFLWRANAWTVSREQRTAEFDAWFSLIGDPWHRAEAARSSFWNRGSSDRAAARAWLSSLENVDPEIIRTTLRDDANKR